MLNINNVKVGFLKFRLNSRRKVIFLKVQRLPVSMAARSKASTGLSGSSSGRGMDV